MREYCCMAVESRLEALVLRAFSSSNACFARDEPSSKRVGGVGLSRQSYVRGVALSREPPKLQQAQPLLAKCHRYCALSPSYDTRCWRAELGMRHAGLRRDAAAVIAATPASALLYDTAMWYTGDVVWVRACGRVFCGGMSDAMDSKTRFRLNFSRGRCSRKSNFFRLDLHVESLSRKKTHRKSSFGLCKMPDWASVRKEPFLTDGSDYCCVRIGLKPLPKIRSDIGSPTFSIQLFLEPHNSKTIKILGIRPTIMGNIFSDYFSL